MLKKPSLWNITGRCRTAGAEDQLAGNNSAVLSNHVKGVRREKR